MCFTSTSIDYYIRLQAIIVHYVTRIHTGYFIDETAGKQAPYVLRYFCQ